MNDKGIQAEAHKAFEDLKSGKDKNDLSGVMRDIEDARSKMTPKEYGQYLQQLNKETATVLPNIEIVGIVVQDRERKLVVNDDDRHQCAAINADEARRLGAVRTWDGNVDRDTILGGVDDKGFAKHEKRGDLNVTVNSEGEITSVTERDGFPVYRKGPDGKWLITSKEIQGNFGYVENLTVDAEGNLAYDYKVANLGNRHVAQGADGSTIVSESNIDGKIFWNNDGKTVWDTDGKVTEAPAGDGKSRQFHYDTKGDLDQIDGRLGHWERTFDQVGNAEWVNKDRGEVWNGDMTVDSDGTLHYKGRSGGVWAFTLDGRDVNG